MARLRRFSSYRRTQRPYTRVSKFREKSYIRMTPNTRIIRFDMGNLQKTFPCQVKLAVKTELNIRDNAIESARTVSNRVLESTLGTTGFNMKVRAYPHHVLRENPIASGAGADRFSTGMKKSFGKPIGQACLLKKGQVLFQVGVDEKNIPLAKTAMRKAATKLPCTCSIEIVK
ncbi:MAG: 50S ribosomal protein L16 [Nanoarchaeota archaeon]|nr:50S ribosomal protein L16 [Nanoarchaeota archaeon]MBU1704324.1 50S ribosomal protein L16 [Nanoarchaeota archaeon]